MLSFPIIKDDYLFKMVETIPSTIYIFSIILPTEYICLQQEIIFFNETIYITIIDMEFTQTLYPQETNFSEILMSLEIIEGFLCQII